jgi:hypothetical protein
MIGRRPEACDGNGGYRPDPAASVTASPDSVAGELSARVGGDKTSTYGVR